jgi:hypothetical protein
MSQHFLLSAAARTLSLSAVARMSDEEAHAKFIAIRWADTTANLIAPNAAASRSTRSRPESCGNAALAAISSRSRRGPPSPIASGRFGIICSRSQCLPTAPRGIQRLSPWRHIALVKKICIAGIPLKKEGQTDRVKTPERTLGETDAQSSVPGAGSLRFTMSAAKCRAFRL